ALQHLVRLVDDCGATLILSDERVLGQHRSAFYDAGGCDSIAWRDIGGLDVLEAPGYRAAPQDLAFLQYTSGSTSVPKGVMVRHANIAANMEMIRAAFGHDEHSTMVGWLPLFHDQGLLGNLLQPLWVGASSVHMTPTTFAKRPWLWLQAISDHRAHTSGGPNFAYERVLAHLTPERLENVDLRCWRVAFNGAEPVRADTMERFARVLKPHGFDPRAHYPCYGLAEGTLFVSGGQPGALPRVRHSQAGGRHRTLVGSGHPWGDLELAVVSVRTGRRLAPMEEGEIWLRGSSIAQGYYRNERATRGAFGARLAGQVGCGFLRTGDLGFVDERGELFVSGRLKDMVIVDGRNLYPQDIELTVARCHARFVGVGAVFGVDEGAQVRLVAVQEWRPASDVTFEALTRCVRRAVRTEHGVTLAEFLLVRRGQIPRTTSGKVQRNEARGRFLRKEYSGPGTFNDVDAVSLRRPSLATSGAQRPTPAPTRERLAHRRTR
ncbi:MAG: fatty acyl-AMP ligase, partial [Myxococcales bacterium]|nr:fatty acyl-AMP ligase [Myxococcales bacterium]